VEKLGRLLEYTRATIIAIAGYGQQENRQRSRAADFDEHPAKPITPEAIQRVLPMSQCRS
jgi:CheY-like chemotaxis protein